MSSAKAHPLLVPPPHVGPEIPYEELLENARQSLPKLLPEKPKEVMLALDIDGTLLRHDGASPRVRRVLQEALEAQVNVVIATGRGISSTHPVFVELGLPDGLSVSSNGAQTVHWERKNAQRYQPTLLRQVLFAPESAARKVVAAIPGVLLSVDDGFDGVLVNDHFPQGELLARQSIRSLDEIYSTPTPRLIARAPWMTKEEFATALDSLDLEDVEYSVGWTAWVDIGPSGCSKAEGLEILRQELGVAESGTVALGDGSNDVEMLRWAAHGVAMGGADEEVAAAANATTGPVDFDGAAAVIEALLERY